VRSAHIQRDAVAAIRKAGGTVAYNWELDRSGPIPGGRPWAPSWLVELVGVDFFGDVIHVDLSGSLGRADSTLVEVGRLQQLQEIWLGNASVTDAGLVRLKGLTNLSVLWLSGTQVTDAGLVHLKGLTNLTDLGLAGTQVTDAGLVHLEGLTSLSSLDLAGTHVTDAEVKELQRALPSLKIER
jgi:hypothetical protein